MKRLTFTPFILPLLLVVCTLFYYFGELVDWAAWESLRASFFYSIHDVHRLLFLAPIIYAAYTARVRGAVIVTLVSFVIFLPRAFFISPFPDPLLRMAIFTVFAGVVGVLVGVVRNQAERAGKLEASVKVQRDQVLRIMDNMPDGIVITGPDYTVRFTNAVMKKGFGEGVGLSCYAYLRAKTEPCREDCRLAAVINEGKTQRWVCPARDSRSYEVIANPYLASDGAICQVAAFREISRR
jgi:PAS domain-containing protein